MFWKIIIIKKIKATIPSDKIIIFCIIFHLLSFWFSGSFIPRPAVPADKPGNGFSNNTG
jgi:hypothetical protein